MSSINNEKYNYAFLETLSYISVEIGHDPNAWERIYYSQNQGIMGVTYTLIEWADEFEKKNKGKEWNGEWMDELDAFITTKLESINI